MNVSRRGDVISSDEHLFVATTAKTTTAQGVSLDRHSLPPSSLSLPLSRTCALARIQMELFLGRASFFRQNTIPSFSIHEATENRIFKLNYVCFLWHVAHAVSLVCAINGIFNRVSCIVHDIRTLRTLRKCVLRSLPHSRSKIEFGCRRRRRRRLQRVCSEHKMLHLANRKFNKQKVLNRCAVRTQRRWQQRQAHCPPGTWPTNQ